MFKHLLHVLKIGFLPLLATLLLAGHAHGQTTVKVMPLGDSITGSPGCWRALLWNQLQNAGYTNIDFVGTLPAQGCGVTHDGDNEGHGGILATNMANAQQLVPWLAQTNPDIVIMHLGTNDVWSNRSTTSILAAFTTLVNEMRANNPAMKILVAQIIPMDSARSCSTCAQNVIALNSALPAWAAGITTSASPVTIVDQWTGFSAIDNTYDGVHPNESGLPLIADNWFYALAEVLDGGITPPENYPPIACFSGDTAVFSGTTASFDASCSTDADGDSLSFSWTFGDGTSSSGTTAQHTYTMFGEYSVTLTADDGQGNSDSIIHHIAVNDVGNNSSSSASSTSSTGSGAQHCNWYGTLYPLCLTTQSGWGWENNQSCIAVSTCSGQPAPYGVVGSASSSSSSVAVSSSSVASSAVTSSSVPGSASSTPSSSSSSSSTSSMPGNGNCEYVVSNEWNSGFTGAIRITNNGSSAINSWNVSWSYSDATTVTNSWNATVAGSNPYSASNLGWNGTIQPGQTVEFGLQGKKGTATAEVPIVRGSVCGS